MSALLRTSVLIIVLTLIAAALGGWFGVRYGLQHAPGEQSLDQLLHHQLRLSSSQEQQIASLEAGFAVRRQSLETQMRQANRDLAMAITIRHVYDAQAGEAVERLHREMIDLQKATVQHVLAMRGVLTPEQAQQFDRVVNQSLGADVP